MKTRYETITCSECLETFEVHKEDQTYPTMCYDCDKMYKRGLTEGRKQGLREAFDAVRKAVDKYKGTSKGNLYWNVRGIVNEAFAKEGK